MNKQEMPQGVNKKDYTNFSLKPNQGKLKPLAAKPSQANTPSQPPNKKEK